ISSRPPRVVMTLGLHGSASTWAFNVARELMISQFGADSIATFFAASPQALLAKPEILGRHVVCKTHGWPNLHVFTYLTSATVIVTVRDPRDCVLSLMERFDSPFTVAFRGIERDCQYVSACAAVGHPVLRYESRFFDKATTVRTLADHLRIE